MNRDLHTPEELARRHGTAAPNAPHKSSDRAPRNPYWWAGGDYQPGRYLEHAERTWGFNTIHFRGEPFMTRRWFARYVLSTFFVLLALPVIILVLGVLL